MIKLRAITNKLSFVLGTAAVLALAALLRINLIVPSFLLILAIYINVRKPHIKDYNSSALILLFTIIFAASYFIIRRGWPLYYIPFSVVPMLTAILFNQPELALLMSLVTAVSITSLIGSHLFLGVLFFLSGALGGILSIGARRRIDIIRAGAIVGLAQALFLFFIDPMRTGVSYRYIIFVLNGLACGFAVIGILPIFEYLFKTVTNISLLELADFNHPLLQRMTLEAPGTYHHSLIVGNLSDAACRAVGANALLARIGAYYHDIGKLQKPEYFSENQEIKESKHDALSPTMSKLIIMNHVKEGVELAKRYRLNPRIIDFILAHHGNSLVYYFYRRALETFEEDSQLKEEGFRYPGPKPSTKETAIVLLADSVEAASRALKDPTPAKIEEVAHKIINNKFIDGQLDECDLTLKDLERIASVFIRILSGMYHARVNYPESSARENNSNKPAKESSRQSVKDKKNGS